jgi:hypothetical protein
MKYTFSPKNSIWKHFWAKLYFSNPNNPVLCFFKSFSQFNLLIIYSRKLFKFGEIDFMIGELEWHCSRRYCKCIVWSQWLCPAVFSERWRRVWLTSQSVAGERFSSCSRNYSGIIWTQKLYQKIRIFIEEVGSKAVEDLHTGLSPHSNSNGSEAWECLQTSWTSHLAGKRSPHCCTVRKY